MPRGHDFYRPVFLENKIYVRWKEINEIGQTTIEIVPTTQLSVSLEPLFLGKLCTEGNSSPWAFTPRCLSVCVQPTAV